MVRRFLLLFYPSLLLSWMFGHDILSGHLLFWVSCILVFYIFGICACSAQLSMFHMERYSRNTIIINSIINIIIIIIVVIIGISINNNIFIAIIIIIIVVVIIIIIIIIIMRRTTTMMVVILRSAFLFVCLFACLFL